MPKLKIALLSGGVSGEREISLKTGEQIYKALDKNKYEIFRYDPRLTPACPAGRPDPSPKQGRGDIRAFLNDALDKKFDLVFPALHGPGGEDGKLQGALDIIGVPYLFSGTLASALAMDKKKSKIIAAAAGLNIAEDVVLEKNEKYNAKEIIKKLSFPIFIKPLELGSSVGMSKANTEEDLEEGIKTAFEHGEKLILEQFISGRELSVPVMGSPSPLPVRQAGRPSPAPAAERERGNVEALPVIEIKPKKSDWFDYKAKYEAGATEEICPADIPDKIRDEAQNMAIKIFKAIGCKDLARADFIWDNKQNHRNGGAGKIYFLEINTIPGMTATSLAPQSAKAAGMEFREFLDKLILGATKNYEK